MPKEPTLYIGHLQMITGIIRVYIAPNDYDSKGPYEWCCSVVQIDDDTVQLLGVDKRPSPRIWRAVENTLRGCGYKKVQFTRFKRGMQETHTFKDKQLPPEELE